MTRAAVSGAHYVGKSTLLDHLVLRNPGLQVIGNLMRDIAQNGYGVGADTTPATLTVYLQRQMVQEDAVPKTMHLVSDRVFVDGLAYIMAAVQLGINGYNWSQEVLSLLESVARLHATRYDYHVYIPIEFPLSSGDPLHLHGLGFQRTVDQCLRQLLGQDWPITVVEVTGSLEQRTTTVSNLLRKPHL